MTVPIFSFGGAVGRIAEGTTAFPYRDASHDINIAAAWLPEQAADADRHIAWVRKIFAALQPHSRGVYVNFTNDDLLERTRLAYTQSQWARLTELKAADDPTNFFRLVASRWQGAREIVMVVLDPILGPRGGHDVRQLERRARRAVPGRGVPHAAHQAHSSR